MVMELSSIVQEYAPIFSVNTTDEDFNDNLLEVLDQYTFALIDSLKSRYD